ncbi:hypothetical protein Daesc_003769 [Daldinia eschscholtzii]|uniref:Uncharacterized protein n=1 Tax=Daldinia eschscholtzii TaxID=292717 RepID=A0AAX6MN28_9PEZI
MCYFAITRFPCGCLTWKGSEYKFCAERGKGCKTKVLEQYEWQTLCPEARKAVNGKLHARRATFPKCCDNLQQQQLEGLCKDCNSIVDDNNQGLHPFCSAAHRVCVSTGADVNAEREFEKVVQSWPSNLRSRYMRRKQDQNARDCGWSLADPQQGWYDESSKAAPRQLQGLRAYRNHNNLAMSQQQQQQQQHRPGPPYAPTIAAVGGVPSVIPDVPISALFIAIYMIFAATNMIIFQLNNRRAHKFVPSVALFGFCMARIVTLTLRIAWANRQTNVRLAIAASIFVNAGILIVYVVNLIFAQRILRAKQPSLGWNTALRIAYKVLYVGIACALIMVITAVVLSMYSLDPYTLRACRDVQLTSGTYLLVFTTMPVFLTAAAYLLPRPPSQEMFGYGKMRTKAVIVIATACLCMLTSGFKLGTAYSPPRPLNNPAWYHGKAPFYVFNFAVEILILCILTLARIDKRFHIPDGSREPGHYSGRVESSSGSVREISAEKERRQEDAILNDA